MLIPKHRYKITPLFIQVFQNGNDPLQTVFWKDWEHEISKWEGKELHLAITRNPSPPPIVTKEEEMNMVPHTHTTHSK